MSEKRKPVTDEASLAELEELRTPIVLLPGDPVSNMNAAISSLVRLMPKATRGDRALSNAHVTMTVMTMLDVQAVRVVLERYGSKVTAWSVYQESPGCTEFELKFDEYSPAAVRLLANQPI